MRSATVRTTTATGRSTGKTTISSAGSVVYAYNDGDGDGYGAGPGVEVIGCETAPGWVFDGSDCDDGNPAIHPAADEILQRYGR